MHANVEAISVVRLKDLLTRTHQLLEVAQGENDQVQELVMDNGDKGIHRGQRLRRLEGQLMRLNTNLEARRKQVFVVYQKLDHAGRALGEKYDQKLWGLPPPSWLRVARLPLVAIMASSSLSFFVVAFEPLSFFPNGLEAFCNCNDFLMNQKSFHTPIICVSPCSCGTFVF